MADLNEVRKKLPNLASLDDAQLVDAVHRLYYPDMDKGALSKQLGYTPPAPPAESAGVLRTAGDVGIKLAQGAVDLGSSVVGLGSLATGGLVGDGMRAIGYDPQATNDALGEYLSDSQKQADQQVENADGFVDSIAASIKNPRAILGGIARSAPGMLGGMGVTSAVAGKIAARAALATVEGQAASAGALAAGRSATEAAKAALATQAGAKAATEAVEAAGTKLVALGAGVEGAQSAGQIADQAQGAGRSYGDYAAPAIAAGLGTAAIGLGAGKLMGDSATELATGARSAGVSGGLAKRAGKEFFSEGVLEEMPQSAQEQVFTNMAMGEDDLGKGVGNAAGTGLITGGVMGAGMGAMQKPHAAPVQLPNTGPLSQAANAGQAAAAAIAGTTEPDAAAAPGQAAAEAPAAPATPQRSLDDIWNRILELDTIPRGTPAQRVQDPLGFTKTIPSVKGRKFTPEELAEYTALMTELNERTDIPEEQKAEWHAMLDQESEERKAQQAAQQRAAAKEAARIQAEQQDQEIARLLAEEQEQQRAAAQARAQQEVEEQAAREREQMAVTNAIVEHERAARAATNRQALRDDVLKDNAIPADQKKAAFAEALRRDGYANPTLTDEDHQAIERATTPVRSAPNELVDAVPERQAPAPAPAGTNTAAVDAAIAAGMRLKTANGAVLHKPGSTKIFKLSTAQKAHYLARMAELNPPAPVEQAQPQAEVPAAPVEQVQEQAEAPAAPVEQAQAQAEASAAPVEQQVVQEPSPEAAAFHAGAHQAATSPNNDLPEPSQAQKEAGNYKVGRARLHGLDLSIENPQGSTRSGVDRDGKGWETTMQHHYGYIRGTVGADKDHIDVFVGPHLDSDKVFVVDQVHPDSGKFDEHKVMLGFDSLDAARAGYQANYDASWTGGRNITETTVDGFKAWLDSGKTKKPFTKLPPAPAAETAPATAPAPAAPALTKQQLNRKTVKDMSDDELLQARQVFADHPTRGPKVEKEIAQRGLNAAPAALQQQDTNVDAHQEVEVVAPEKGNLYTVKRGDTVLGTFRLYGGIRFEALKAALPAYAVEVEAAAERTVKENKAKSQAEYEAADRAYQEQRAAEKGAAGPEAPFLTGEALEQKAAALWDDMLSPARVSALYAAGLNQDDAQAARLMSWGDLASTLRDTLAQRFAKLEDWRAARPRIAYESKAGTVWDEEALQRENLTPRAAVGVDVLGEEQAGMLAAANLREAQASFDAAGNFIGKYKYRARPNHAKARVMMFTSLDDAKEYVEGYGRRTAPAEPQEKRKRLGKGDRGQTIFENEQGIRSYRESGFKYVEEPGKPREDNFKTEAELAAEKPIVQDAAAREQTVDPTPAPASLFADNKLFTEDRVAAARARLKSKLSSINHIGLDPEVLMDGITIAGAYIEAGVRSFSEYSAVMISDLGESVRPYLRSFYEGVRHYPGLDTEGMSTPAEIDALEQAGTAPHTQTTEEKVPAIGKNVEVKARAKKAPTDPVLRSDWGVEHIDGWAELPGGENMQTDYGLRGGVKDAFLKDAEGYLKKVAAELQAQGFTARQDRKGKPAKAVFTSEGGPAVSGDAYLRMHNEQLGYGIQIDVGASALRGITPTNKSGISIVMRGANEAGSSGFFGNEWMPVDLPASQLAEKAAQLVGRIAARDTVAKPEAMADTPINTKEETNDSTTSTDSPALDTPVAAGQSGDGDVVARGTEQPRERAGRGNARGVRKPRGRVEGPDDARGNVGDGAGDRAVPDGSAEHVERRDQRVSADFRPAVGGLTREGSWYDTAKRNVDLIELARKIEAEGRAATPAEQEQLSKYVGFGASAIRNVLFPVPGAWAKQSDPTRLIWPNLVNEPRWRALAERLDALPSDWQRSVLQSTQYAHYTSENIVRSTWSGLQRLGFTGGKVFEPGMGIGSFAMLMPEDVRSTSRYTGVEFDAPTALIARLLSPEQHMLHDDFIKRKFPANFFDVAIGNPPFSQTKVFGDPDYEKFGFMLHDFFFAKAIDRVRPGGLLAFVTSKGTMDKQTDKARRYLAERADLVGAIRLPSTAFEDNAGTSVVTDVIFLRKRLPGEAPGGAAWANVATVETKDGPVVINQYFAENPDMVLGQNRISGNLDDAGRRINSNGIGGEKYTVVSYDKTPADLDAKFAAAVERLPENVYSVLAQEPESVRRETAKVDFDPRVKREGVIYVGDDGTLMRVESGVGRPLAEGMKMTEADRAWFGGYVKLRDLVQEARHAQATDGNWEPALARLNDAYDAFRAEHGPINDFRVQVRKSTDEEGKPVETEIRIYKNRRRFREDYDAAILTQLETINEAGQIVKSPFLKGRTIGKPVTRDVKTIGDALAVSLDSTGRLDLDDIGRRIGLSRDEAIDALGDQVYKTPSGAWQLADEYLSGNVVVKLEEAEQAARLDESLKRNIEALKAVQPEKLGPSQISAKLGASWVPAAHVNAFAEEIGAGRVTFDPTTETWQVDGGNLRSGRRAGAEYGTAARSPSELLEAALNSRTVKITVTTEDKKTVTDVAATTAANEMLKKIKDKFKGWVWTDAERASELMEAYNHRFNNIAPRRFDGSYLTLPGVSLRYKLHPHQLRAIARVIQTGDTYLMHSVGAGKTIEMIAAGMEQKRLGLIKKPIYVVPNHMLEQFSNEFMELYPLANLMVADDENFTAERRKAFIANATLNNPDAIIITHDAFQRIGVKEETVAPIRDEILMDLEIELSDTAKDAGARVRRSQLEQQIEAVTQRFDRIISAGGKDSTIKFEDIGADFIFADEAHVYRKLDFHTSQQIKGIDPNGSKRALDMYVKSRYLQKQRPGRAMVFASGTAVTNTMGELYTIMRFFAPQEMDRDGISTFDAWSRQFGEVAPALEPNAAGKYELVERFARFDNVPELMARVRQFMDVLTSEQLGALVKRPDLKGGKPNLNIVQPSDALEEYMSSELAPRIEKSKNWKPTKEEPNNPDPIVAIITDGRFAAIDPRFFGGQLGEEGSIITEMADKVVANYHAGTDNVYLDRNGNPEPVKGSTQIVFYNLGFGEQSQINRGFNSRSAFTKRLTDGGIPRDQIAWFDDANTDAKKEAVFKAVRSGEVRVLIGSAKKMGTGVNVQKRLAVLHYQDPPWYPADVEQPHGRIIRQGNQNPEVAIEWYTTKGTYQSTMWQMVARKQRFIDQAFTGDKNMRSMDDMGEASLFEQAAAVASGDPRAVQLAGLKQDVERFERLQAAHANEQINVRSSLRNAEWDVESMRKRIATYEPALATIGGRMFTFTSGSVGNASYDKLGEFGQAVKDAFNTTAADSSRTGKAVKDKLLGRLADGVTVTIDGEPGRGSEVPAEFTLYVNVGDLPLSVTRADLLGPTVDAVGLARRIINQVNSIDSDLRRFKSSLASSETDVVKLRKKLGAPFEYQQEMAEKYAELKRLEEELRAEGMQKTDPAVINADGSTAAEAAVAAPDDAPASEGSAEYFRDDGNLFLPQVPSTEQGGAAAPAELPGAELLQAKKATELLNRQLDKAGMERVRTLRAAPNANFALARQVGKALGIDVHFVSKSSDFEGVAYQGAAYLAEGMRNPELAIAGHETLHALEQSNPELGGRLRARIRTYLRDGVVEDRQVREYAANGFKDVSIEQAEAEVIADINGAMWLDPQFWSDLARADRSLFRTVAYKFMELATTAIGSLRGSRFDAGALVKDVEAVRAVMVETWAEHAAGRDAATTAGDFTVQQNSGSNYNDPYDHTPIRPGTVPAQLKAGRDALAALSRRIGADRIRDRDNSGRTVGSVLGSRLLSNFVAGRPNQLIGQIARTPADLAALAQVYRDPRFETFRVIYTAGDTVVGEAGYTSRLPAVVATPNSLVDQMMVDKQRFGADGYYLMHNHPNGNSEPSEADQRMTTRIAGAVGGLRGHVVIDHNEYSVLRSDGLYQVVKAPELNGRDFTSTPELEHKLLGVRIAGPLQVAQLAKALQIPSGHATLVLTDADGSVQLLVDVPMGALRDATPLGVVKGKALMRRMARTSGSGGNRFIVLPEGADVDQFQHWVKEGVVTDVVAADAETARRNGAQAGPDFLRTTASVFSFRQGEQVPQFSRAGLADALTDAANNVAAVRLPAGYLVGDLFNRTGKVSWWHKTIGTMDNLARRYPAFAKVHEAVQSFIGDVSRFAVAAADMAPTLLPKLETWKDMGKKPLDDADNKAIAAPIFEGTLTWARDAHGKPVKVAELEEQAKNLTVEQKAQILLQKGVIDDQQLRAWLASPQTIYEGAINRRFEENQLKAGVVWSDAELRTMFNLNDKQIGVYREFRAALDKSLTNLTISEMIKMGGKAGKAVLEQAVAAPDLDAAAILLRNHFVELARENPGQADMHLDTAHQIMNLADKGKDLMDRGYAPLSRFGKYTVYVEGKDEHGQAEQVYFGMFETPHEAAKMARDMRAAHPEAEVTQGTTSEDAYKLFNGISPETIELFGSMVGLDSQADAASTEVYQAYLKMAKANRSAMKRLIHRKGIAGFSEDAGRVLAGFIYSNARLTSANVHLGEVDEAITEIPKQQGELADAAMQLREHIRNPQGGGSLLGGMMFAQFLGGSVASAMVNLTQPFAMTLPYLTQWGGLTKASARLGSAIRDAGKKETGEAQLDAALKWAADEGIVAPQEIHYLQAQAAGKGSLQSGDGTRMGDARARLNNTMAKVSLGWGKLFAMAELTNRRVTFIAAYRTAVEEGIANPERFAQEAVGQTQGIYNTGNKPRWARNPVGSLLMTFKQYSIGYLELLTRMAFAGKPGSKERAAGRRGALYMLAVLFLLGGADGLPFEQDLEDAIDGLLQRLGYNFSTKRKKQEFLTGLLGQGGADFALKGVSSMPGMPIDVAGRFGMGNLIPGTGMLTKKDSYTRDLGELVGPAGDLAQRAFSASGKALGGDIAGAALDLSPAAVRNAAKGLDMLASGEYKDARGYTVNKTSTVEGVMKIVGFQPNSTADIQDAKGQALNMLSQTRMRQAEIAEHWAQGIAKNDPAMTAEARAWRDDWNAKNPEARVKIDMAGVMRRVKAMRQDAMNRTQKSAPAALKATVRRELQETRE